MIDKRPRGMRAFWVVWAGQLVSILGTTMTGFALPIYVFGETSRVQELALVGLAFVLPQVLFSPTAGAIVDRYDRKLMMIISDSAAGVMTVVVLALLATGRLQIWHLYVTSAISGAFQALQWPAYSAAISVMIPKAQYARAHSLNSLAESGSGIFGPLLAGALIGVIGLQGILLIDIVTFLFAVGTLILVIIPSPPATAAGASQGNLWRDSLYGFRYIWDRPSLLLLQMVFFAGNFLFTLAFTVMPALILLRTNNNELVFGTVQAFGGAGALVGGLIMSAWGGPKRLIHGVLQGWFWSSLLGMVFFGLGREVVAWSAAIFLSAMFIPLVNGSNQAIWQRKVAPDVQGRVFAVRLVIATITAPLARLLAIPLADRWLGPAMLDGGALAPSFGWLVGTGPGAGLSLIYIGTGILAALVALFAYGVPAVRDVESRLPDHDAAPAST